MRTTLASVSLVVVFSGLAIAQAPPPAEGPTAIQEGPAMQVGPPMEGPVVRERHMVYRLSGPGKWWKDSAMMKKVGVSDEQV